MAIKTISGSSIVLQVHLLSSTSSPTDVAASTNGVLSISSETIDITSKGSGGNKDFMHGVTSWTVDCDAYVLSDGTGNSSYNWALAAKNGTKINMKFYDTSGQSASKAYTGMGFVTSWTETGAVGEFSTYSATIQGTGALTIA